jgi:hypothetical protein
MTPRSLPSTRRANAKRQARPDYLSFYCTACGRVGYAARCSTCAEVVYVDRASCHSRHQSREYIAQRSISVGSAAK